MKKNIIFTFFLIVSLVTTAAEQVQLDAKANPASVSPQMISHFSDKILKDTYVSVASVFAGGAWIAQQVFVNVGGTEEVQDTFSFRLMGEISKVQILESYEDGSIQLVITSDRGSWSTEEDTFLDGYTDYHVSIKKDPNTETGYANKANLLKKYFVQK